MALYWCHQCERQTPRYLDADPETIMCSFCHGDFLEEIENTHSPSPVVASSLPLPFPMAGLFGMPFSLMSGATAASNGGQISRMVISGHEIDAGPMMSVISPISGAVSAEQADQARPALIHNRNPLLVIEGDLSSLGGLGIGPQTLRGRIGDYVMGSDLDRLIQMLSENDPNRYGTPPAAKSAVEAMPTLKIEPNTEAEEAIVQCAVCKEDFEAGEEARQMPCKHLYHADCILPWLSQHSTCPVCRHQMPTEEGGENRNADQTGATAPSVSLGATSEDRLSGSGNNSNAEEDSLGGDDRNGPPALLPLLFRLLSSFSSLQPLPAAPVDIHGNRNSNPTRSDSDSAILPASHGSGESLSGMKLEEMD